MDTVRIVKHTAFTVHKILFLARQKKIDFVAGGITYYEFLSLAPLIILVFLVLSTIGGEEMATSITLTIGDFIPSIGNDIVRSILTEDLGRSSVIGFFVLLWASLQLFRSFNIAFEQIYNTPHATTLLEEVEDAFTALVTISIAVTLTVAAGIAVTAFPRIQLVGAIWILAQFTGLTIIFIPFYHVFTENNYSVKQLLPGALIAAAGWTLLQTFFSLYTHVVGGSIFSVFGGILLLVVWMYIGNILILLGAVVNLVHNRHNVLAGFLKE